MRGFAPDWAPLLWNLAEQDPAALLASSRDWIRTLTVVRTEEAELAEFETAFRQVCRSLDELQRHDRMRALDLLGFVLSWMTKRRPSAEVAQLRQALRESLTNQDAQREIDQMASKLGPTIEDVARSDQELLSARRYLLKLLSRWGTVSEEVTAKIQNCRDLSGLENWFEQATRIQTLADFRPE